MTKDSEGRTWSKSRNTVFGVAVKGGPPATPADHQRMARRMYGYGEDGLTGAGQRTPQAGTPAAEAYANSARDNGHAGSTNSHGSESCPSCGGYSSPLADTGSDLLKSCRSCGDTSAQSKGNKMKDFLGQTVADYG